MKTKRCLFDGCLFRYVQAKLEMAYWSCKYCWSHGSNISLALCKSYQHGKHISNVSSRCVFGNLTSLLFLTSLPSYLPTTPNLKSSTTCTLCCFLSPICSLHSPLSNKGWKGSRETDDIINLLKTEKCLECKVDACCHVVTFFSYLSKR